MKYSIGEFAAILGVTVDTLRLYEKHGIIKPIKDNKNNYRYFDDLDARNLLMSRWYRSMEIPLQDVSMLTKEPSLDKIIEKLQEKQLNLEAEIKKSTMLLNKVIEVNKDLKETKLEVNKCKIRKMAGIYRLKQTNKNTLLQDTFLKEVANEWMDLLPYTFYSFKIDHSEIVSNENNLRYSWGLAITEKDILGFNLKINESVEYLSPKTYISSIIVSSGEEYITKKTLDFMMDYLKENDYVIAGDVIGRMIVMEKIEGKKRSYLEVNIPIKS